MANKVISMQQIRALIQLLEKGYSLRAISVQLSISRQSATLYAIRLKKSGHPMEVLRKLSSSIQNGVLGLMNVKNSDVYLTFPKNYPKKTKQITIILYTNMLSYCIVQQDGKGGVTG